MSLKTPGNPYRFAIFSLAAAALVAAGCGSGSLVSTTQSTSGATGSAFVVGTDAPLASVVSFATTVTVTATPSGGGTAVPITSGAQTVDFARYNGLQTLLDETAIKAGSYQSITITLGSGTIGYLNFPASGAPTISTKTAVYASATNPVTITLPTPFIVPTTGAPAGLRIDFDLAKSIGVDSTGAITGAVTPTFDVSTVKNTDATAHIDEQVGAVVSLPKSTTEPSSFVIQGPHGEQFTINTDSKTEWDGGASLGSLNANSVVAVAGQLDVADQTLDADEVALITDSHFYARGLVTYVAPSSGQATNMDFYVRAVVPSSDPDVPLGGIAQVNVSGNEKYGIYWMHNAFTQLLFNSYAMTPGQEIAVGGTDAEANPTSGTAITVNRIHLQNWGYNGTIVPKTQSSAAGSFTMQITGFAGQVVPSNVTVFLGPDCDFRFGFGAFNDLTDSTKVRVVGLLLKNSTNGQLVLLARHVDGIDFTNFATTAF
jgi:hypothetical protein